MIDPGPQSLILSCLQTFEVVLFCVIFAHIVVVTSESGIPEAILDTSSRKVAAQAFDVLVLLFYLCASLHSQVSGFSGCPGI